jgi:hypothetical protein
MTGHGAGKGDRPRPVDRKKWEAGWERVFGKTTRGRAKRTDTKRAMHGS